MSTYQPTTTLTYRTFVLTSQQESVKCFGKSRCEKRWAKMFACFAWTSVKQKARPSTSVKSFGVFCKLSNAFLGSVTVAGSLTTRIRWLQQQASKLLRHPTRIPGYLQIYVGDTLITQKQFVYEASLTKHEQHRVVQALDACESVSVMWDEDDAWAVDKARKSSYFFDPHFLVVNVYTKVDAHIMALNTTHQVDLLSLQAQNQNKFRDPFEESRYVVYESLDVLEGFTNIKGLNLLNVVPCNPNIFSRLLNLQAFSMNNTTRRDLVVSFTQLIDVLAGLPCLEKLTLDGFSNFSSNLVRLTNLKHICVNNANFSVYQLFTCSSKTNTLLVTLLASLQTVAIKDCTHMNKSIPPEIGLMTKCRDLCVSKCSLEGKIPTELGLAQSLTKLCLAINQLTGTIPTELGLLTNLTILELQSNLLSNNIPCSLDSLTRLERLDLSYNKLTGAIPPTKGLTSLSVLDLTHNELSGAIPATLSNLANLTTLDVSFNKLTGQVPSELARLYKLWSFHAYSNNLSPNLPQELLKWVTTSYSHDRKVFLGDNPEYDSDNDW